MEGPVLGIVVLTAFAILLSLTVLYLLLSIKYKEFTVFLKIGLITYDLLLEISILIFCFLVPSPLSKDFSFYKAFNQTQFIYSRSIHSVQIFYMAWALYKAIVKKSIVSNKAIFKFALFSNILTLGIALTYVILLILFPNSYTTIGIIFTFFIQDIPSILISFPLIWFYYHIRKTLKQEFLASIPIAQQKRAIAKQLIFYPIIFLLYFVIYLLTALTIFKAIESSDTLVTVLETSLCIYPILNSLCYGISNSTKRFMYAVCLRDKEYDEIEEAENELRNEKLIAPRVYSDFLTSS
jgi:hypothetical protein